MQKLKKLSPLVLALTCCAFPVASSATDITFTVLAAGRENVIRDDIDRSTFGSGVEHPTSQFRDAVVTPSPATAPTLQMMKSLNLGMMRFSSGTPGQWYLWDKPTWGPAGGYRPLALTQDDMFAAVSRDRLDMQLLFQLNTGQYVESMGERLYDPSDDQITYMHKARTDPARDPMVINPAGLDRLAGVAAGWVADNKQRALRNPAQKVTYWEVGNEDWSYWTPAEYVQIFNAYAARIKQEDGNAKLLAQSFTTRWTINGKADNTDSWLTDMLAANIRTADVYALSDHQYMAGTLYPEAQSLDELRSWQVKDMFGTIHNETRMTKLKATLTQKGLPWKIWVTEYNEHPTSGNTVDFRQDLAHALVLADWTGKLLERGADKILMTSLDHHPHFSLVQYVNWGGTIQSPYISAPGHAFAKYAKSFGKKLVKHAVVGHMPQGLAKNGKYYDQVAIYPSIRESDPFFGGGPSMRVMLVNRSLVEHANVTLKTQNRPIAGEPKRYYVDELTSDGITDSNKTTHNQIEWRRVVDGARTTATGITYQMPPKSAAFVTVPLQ